MPQVAGGPVALSCVLSSTVQHPFQVTAGSCVLSSPLGSTEFWAMGNLRKMRIWKIYTKEELSFWWRRERTVCSKYQCDFVERWWDCQRRNQDFCSVLVDMGQVSSLSWSVGRRVRVLSTSQRFCKAENILKLKIALQRQIVIPRLTSFFQLFEAWHDKLLNAGPRALLPLLPLCEDASFSQSRNRPECIFVLASAAIGLTVVASQNTWDLHLEIVGKGKLPSTQQASVAGPGN